MGAQAKVQLEKVKQTLETANEETANEAKHLSEVKQESERKRKQLEQQNQELGFRYGELERAKQDLTDRCAKLQVTAPCPPLPSLVRLASPPLPASVPFRPLPFSPGALVRPPSVPNKAPRQTIGRTLRARRSASCQRCEFGRRR